MERDARVIVLEEAMAEVEGVYGIIMPIEDGSPMGVRKLAKLILGGLLEYGVCDSVHAYWAGKFEAVGIR